MTSVQAGIEGRSSPPNDSQSHIRLACQACQRKKIKCDRTFPCGQCTKSNLSCVQSSRKQRVRHAGKRGIDGELRSRIAKLESLVETLSGDGAGPTGEDAQNDPQQASANESSAIDHASPAMDRYVASHFWSSLSGEVAALRDALEEDDEDEETPDTVDDTVDDTDESSAFAHVVPTLEHDFIICPPGRIFIMPGAIEEPSPQAQKKLIQAFFENVEVMSKIFHAPTLRALVENNAPYLGHASSYPANKALKRLVWFTAMRTMSESEILQLTGRRKEVVLPIYRRSVGVALSQTDLINTSDLGTLQCFTLFIAVCRSMDTSRRTWTIMAIIVRIAYALDLHREDSHVTPYMREIRRRLWHGIRFLDKFCAIDRGSPPLIGPDAHTTALPTNTNDHLFSPSSTSIPVVEDQITDMSFALMCYEACDTVEHLNTPEAQPGGATWEKRHQMALAFANRIERKYLRFCDLNDDYQRLRHAVGESMGMGMILRAVRPMQRHVSSTPPPVHSPYVLKLAVDNLRASYDIVSDPTTERWRWMAWVPWHGLAVALAGLCSIRGTDLANTAWFYVEYMYLFSEAQVADGKGGMLWLPIKKLYKKASEFRDADPALQSQSLLTNQTSSGGNSTQSAGQGSSNDTSPPTWTPPSTKNSSLEGFHPKSVDGLSANLSSLDPFAFTETSTSNPTINPALPPVMMPGADFNAPLTDTSWVDWGQIMDEFASPIANPSVNMDVDFGVDSWNWNGDTMNGVQTNPQA